MRSNSGSGAIDSTSASAGVRASTSTFAAIVREATSELRAATPAAMPMDTSRVTATSAVGCRMSSPITRRPASSALSSPRSAQQPHTIASTIAAASFTPKKCVNCAHCSRRT